jgi:hypothetical protein
MTTACAQTVPMECCNDWRAGIPLINGPIALQTIRSGGRYQYRLKPFAFCPWCGAKRPPAEPTPPSEG